MQGGAHKRGDGHGADPTRDRCDEPDRLFGFVELHIAHQSMATLLGGIRDGVEAHIDDRRDRVV